MPLRLRPAAQRAGPSPEPLQISRRVGHLPATSTHFLVHISQRDGGIRIADQRRETGRQAQRVCTSRHRGVHRLGIMIDHKEPKKLLLGLTLRQSSSIAEEQTRLDCRLCKRGRSQEARAAPMPARRRHHLASACSSVGCPSTTLGLCMVMLIREEALLVESRRSRSLGPCSLCHVYFFGTFQRRSGVSGGRP